MKAPTIAVLGASGLIGQALAEGLADAGFRVVAVARRFTRAQRAAFGEGAVEMPFVTMDGARLGELLAERDIDVVVNCVGVLQDSGRGGTEEIHAGFVARLLAAVAAHSKPLLLIHLSVPGEGADDTTAFSRSKRMGESLIAAAGSPFVILRPGFVVAPVAYGGGALMRALAATPACLPADLAERPFAPVAMADILRTVAQVVDRWRDGQRSWAATWDLAAREPETVGTVLAGLRRRFGGPAPAFTLPGWLLALGAHAGDTAARLGWSPPVRTTSLAELRRGVAADPDGWIDAMAFEPMTFGAALRAMPASIQERWFGRLYLAKAVILAGLALFWIATGVITLAFGFTPAAAILAMHGLPPSLTTGTTVVTSLADIAIGLAIMIRRSARAGLWLGIALSLLYVVAATLLTPELWLDPLGPLVKIGPAVALMSVALMLADDR